ncbi:MAG: aminoacyl-tRNA hydrolase [Gammaproteobacteria bacterium]|jgi:peptidyl-tRNA hydrolase, PTH1 family|nr:aminoacyl-tRNA hydrolase [Gammaproteobacteria bacterium]
MSDLTQTASPLPLKMIAGIGNPGAEYANTRHNAGVWFVERLAEKFGASFKPERKFFGRTTLINVNGIEVRLLVPNTYMNESGKSVGALASFFKIAPPEMLIAHDEIDFPSGKIRFKQEGGLAGHNGLRDISSRLAGAKDFNRLRIGVGHPGDRSGVTGHVLGKVSRNDRELIDNCIEDAIATMTGAVTGNWQLAMQQLHNV